MAAYRVEVSRSFLTPRVSSVFCKYESGYHAVFLSALNSCVTFIHSIDGETQTEKTFQLLWSSRVVIFVIPNL